MHSYCMDPAKMKARGYAQRSLWTNPEGWRALREWAERQTKGEIVFTQTDLCGCETMTGNNEFEILRK